MASNAMGAATGGTAPQSVENITRIAQNYEYNSSVPLRYWLRTAATLLREVGYTCCLHLDHDYLGLANFSSLVRPTFTNAKDTMSKPISFYFAMLS